jgi:hypothetical protein
MSADTMTDRVRSADPELPEQFRYERLLSLSVRHDFYGRSGLCRDFVITPTAATQILLRNLGLVAKPRPGGFDVFYHSSRAAAIVRHLCNRRDDHGTRPFDLARLKSSSWDRLTLIFTLDNPMFTNFTEMPFALRPGRDCLYVSNHGAGAGDGAVRLAVDWPSFITIQETQQLIFSPAYLHLSTPEDATQVVFYDSSGRAFLRAEKDYDPSKPSEEIPPVTGLDPERHAHLDMTQTAAGRYSYIATDNNKKSGDETYFLYTGMDNAPLLMVDLFLDGPDGPVSLPKPWPAGLDNSSSADMARQCKQNYIKPRHYEIHFEARKTIWTYYIVLPPGSPASSNLSIEAEAASTDAEAASEEAPAFNPPKTGTLAGRSASIFTAIHPVKLQSRPNISLRLRGAGANGSGSARILLDRLPLPSAETILPPRTTDGHAVSEVFVYL